MGRMLGTVSMGIRAPIIREGDDLVEIAVNSVLEAAASEGYEIRNREVIALTESIVARVQGNYVTVDDIAADVRAKFGGETVKLQLGMAMTNEEQRAGKLVNSGVINGYEDNTFRPRESATRAEAAKIIYFCTSKEG